MIQDAHMLKYSHRIRGYVKGTPSDTLSNQDRERHVIRTGQEDRTMTKKDYIKAAVIVADHGSAYDKEALREEKTLLANGFIQLFEGDNPNFDQDRFLIACGLKDKK
jgi:hypothetical protein